MTDEAAPRLIDFPAPEGAARGWYPDPQNPARERWHDGVAFTEHTHRALRNPSMLGADFDRSLWPGANLDARRAQRAGHVSFVLFLLVIIAVALIPVVPWAFTAVGIGMLGIAMAAALQVAIGVRAARKARIVGGLGASLTAVFQGLMQLVLAMAYFAFRIWLALSP